MEEISVVGLSSTMALEGLAIDDFTLLQKSGAILLAGELRKRFGDYQVACNLERSSEIMCDLVSRLPKIYEDEVIYLQKRKENVSTVETGELIQALEREKDGVKELFKKKFMSELTNINPLEIEKVQQGMMRSTIQLYEYMNQEYHKAVENQLLNVFYQQIEFYLEEYCMIRMKNLAITNIRTAMRLDLQAVETTHFQWTESAISQGKGMEQVIFAINRSVDDYFNQWKTYIEQIKGILENYLNSFISQMEHTQTTSECKIIACNVNYKRLEKEFDVILEYCGGILTDGTNNTI